MERRVVISLVDIINHIRISMQKFANSCHIMAQNVFKQHIPKNT